MHGARQLGAAGATGEAGDDAAGVRVPLRAAEPGERGDEGHSTAVGDRRGERADVGRRVDDPEAVAQPLDGGARDEGRALQCVGDGVTVRAGVGAEVPRHADDEAVGWWRSFGSGVGEYEAAGAVRDLHHAGVEAGLAEERRLLIAEDGRDGGAVEGRGSGAEIIERGGAEAAGGGTDLGERVGGDGEEAAELGGPREGGGIEEERAARVGGVGGVRAAVAAAGELPQHPRVDRAEGEVGVVGREGEVAVAKEPGRLRGAEVRVEDEAGRGAHQREVAGGDELLAEGRGAAVLPDDGAVERLAGGAVERYEGLALVGDADGGDLLAGGGLGQAGADLGEGGADGGPDLVGVVLHPPRVREVLGQLAVGNVGDPGLLVDDQGADAGRSRIDGDHFGHGKPTLTPPRWGHPGARRANHREQSVTWVDAGVHWLTRA